MPSPYAGFTTTLLNSVDAAVRGYTQNAYQAIVQAHQTEINLALVLYTGIFGYLVLTGEIDFTLRRAVRHLVMLGIVTALATHWDIFALFFNNVFTEGPSKLIGAMTGGSFEPNAMLSEVFDKGILAANEINKSAGLSTLGFLIVGYTVFYGTLIAIGYALFLLVLSKLALAVLLGLAPLFFMLLLFQATRDFFSSYLRQVVNFALIPVFTSAIISLTLRIVNDAIVRLQNVLASHSGHGGPECVYVILCLAVLFMLLHQVMGFSNGVSGGLQLHHGNVAGMAAGLAIGRSQIHATQIKSGVGALSRLAWRKTAAGAGKARTLLRRKPA